MSVTSTRFLARVAAHFLRIDPEMTVSRAHIFLLVHQKGECTVRDLCTSTGLNQSTVARQIALLHDKPHRGVKAGLELVTLQPDPEEPRRMLISLSPKGKRLIAELQSLAD